MNASWKYISVNYAAFCSPKQCSPIPAGDVGRGYPQELVSD